MPVKTILFDLDGTLLPMNQDLFIETYFSKLAEYMTQFGYDPKELSGVIWKGTIAMLKNDGSSTNEELFWTTCTKLYGNKLLEDIPHFNEFYSEVFNSIENICGKNPEAAKTVHKLKKMGYRLILATNPVFPPVATENRIRWAGLEPSVFDYYTTYENSSYSKPNPGYYKEIIEKLSLVPSECIMVGNDTVDDMIAETLGMNVFLLSDCLINNNNADINAYPHGSFTQLMEHLNKI